MGAKRAAIIPSWAQTLGASIEQGAHIQVSCTACGRYERVDLVALAEKVGRNYCLINRRCRCRLTPECKGWNRFSYLNGVMRGLWDERGVDRWLAIDERDRDSRKG